MGPGVLHEGGGRVQSAKMFFVAHDGFQVNFTEDGRVWSWEGSPILLDNSFEKVKLTLPEQKFQNCRTHPLKKSLSLVF